MPTPTQPTVTLTRLSNTSFKAAVSGDGGVTNRLYYQVVGASIWTTGNTRVGNGDITQTGLNDSGQYNVYVVADNGSYSLPTFGTVSLASTDSVLGAVKAKWESNAPLVALVTGGLWTGQVPEGTDLPFVQADFDRTTYEWTFGDNYLQYDKVCFTAFGAGAVAVEAILTQIGAVFDWQQLTFGTASSVALRPMSSSIVAEFARWKDGTVVYRGSREYEIISYRS